LFDVDELFDVDLVLLDFDEIEDLVVCELGGLVLFGVRFCENVFWSLLILCVYLGKCMLLW